MHVAPWNIPSQRGREDLQAAQTQGEVTLVTNTLWTPALHKIFYQPWEQGKKRGWSLVIPIKFAFPCFVMELHSHSEICLIKPLYDVNWLHNLFFLYHLLIGNWDLLSILILDLLCASG